MNGLLGLGFAGVHCMPARFSTLLAAALAAACAEGNVQRVPPIIPSAADTRDPVIDVHRHASWPGADDGSARAASIAEMDANGIVLSLLYINEPADISGWLDAAPGRFIGGPAMPCPATRAEPYYRCFADTKGWPPLDWLEETPWLTTDQRRAILYDNAARFLRLDARTLAAHRGG
jgi:hypothetical protein